MENQKYDFLGNILTLNNIAQSFFSALNAKLKRHKSLHKLNSTDALILFLNSSYSFNTKELICKRQIYTTNPSYNLKKLRALGYLEEIENDYDMRCIFFKVTQKGLEANKEINVIIKDIFSEIERRAESRNGINLKKLTIQNLAPLVMIEECFLDIYGN